jgi:hypothetical protein
MGKLERNKRNSQIHSLTPELLQLLSPSPLWTGGFFRIFKGLSIIRIVQPSAGVHHQGGGSGRWCSDPGRASGRSMGGYLWSSFGIKIYHVRNVTTGL